MIFFQFIFCLAILNSCLEGGIKINFAPPFKEGVVAGEVKHPNLNEISGMVESRSKSGIFWVHNDSGDKSHLYLMNDKGNYLGLCKVKGASNRDWEDIAIGPGPVKGINYIYIGDIGDNKAVYDVKVIYRFPEPDISNMYFPIETSIKKVEKIFFRFPDENRDAETLMIDPLTRDIFVISKREPEVRIYVARYPQSISDTLTLEFAGSLDFSQAVGGDISANGREILIKSYTSVYYWTRNENESVEQALKKNPKRLPYKIEPQGESIAWKTDGTGYYTFSERLNDEIPLLYYYKRNEK
jgi:hypothetical protein